MNRIKIFQIDAFTDKVFHGNPAAICLLSEWLNDELMQAIAFENNLSETAFIIEDDSGYHIRWFTPNGEIDICGHATLAAGFLLFELRKIAGDTVSFSSLSGPLQIRRKDGLLTLNFPRLNFSKMHDDGVVSGLIDVPSLEVFDSDLDYILLLANEKQVLHAHVNLPALAKLPKRGLILTASCTDADFYSRCFYPKHKIDEDPVTGTAHCVLAPFWSDRLNKKNLHSIQGSLRKGEIFCKVQDDRVYLSGYCKWYSKGTLVI